MDVRDGWWPETVDLYSCMRELSRSGRCYMVVERLPTGQWEWLAWQNDLSGAASRGECGTAHAAMRSAAAAADSFERERAGRCGAAPPAKRVCADFVLAIRERHDYVLHVGEDAIGFVPSRSGISHLLQDLSGHWPVSLTMNPKVSV